MPKTLSCTYSVTFGERERNSCAIRKSLVRVRNEEFLGGEEREQFRTGFGDDQFFFDACSRVTVVGWPVRLQSENHSRLDLDGVLQRVQATDDGALV